MNNKELQLVSFEQAKRLKEAGFDREDVKFFDSNGRICEWGVPHQRNHNAEGKLTAPTVALALKWFREEKILTGFVDRNACGWYWAICKADNGTLVKDFDSKIEYDVYESAELALEL